MCQRAAEIGHPYSFDPVIGTDAQSDDRVLRIGVFRKTGKRLVVRQKDYLRMNARDFHDATP
jgi:hypothetical protein